MSEEHHEQEKGQEQPITNEKQPVDHLSGEEQHEHEESFDWGEEYGEEMFEDDEEQELEWFMPFRLSGKYMTLETTIKPGYGMKVKNIALSADNESKTRHIVELCTGIELQNKAVLARLIPGVIESQPLSVTVPAQLYHQTIVFTLTGGKDLGDVDICVQFYREEYEDDEEEYAEDEECSCCNHEHDHHHHQHHHDNNPEPAENSQSFESDDVIKTLQQQKDDIMKDKQPKPVNPFEQRDQANEVKEKPQWRNVKGVQIMDLKVGHGPVAQIGHKVTVKYQLHLNNKQGKFIERSKKNFTFALGRGEVISGWEIGVAGMKVGGKRALIIPPHLGYGKHGAGSEIPPNSTLYFEVELVNAKK